MGRAHVLEPIKLRSLHRKTGFSDGNLCYNYLKKFEDSSGTTFLKPIEQIFSKDFVASAFNAEPDH